MESLRMVDGRGAGVAHHVHPAFGRAAGEKQGAVARAREHGKNVFHLFRVLFGVVDDHEGAGFFEVEGQGIAQGDKAGGPALFCQALSKFGGEAAFAHTAGTDHEFHRHGRLVLRPAVQFVEFTFAAGKLRNARLPHEHGQRLGAGVEVLPRDGEIGGFEGQVVRAFRPDLGFADDRQIEIDIDIDVEIKHLREALLGSNESCVLKDKQYPCNFQRLCSDTSFQSFSFCRLILIQPRMDTD